MCVCVCPCLLYVGGQGEGSLITLLCLSTVLVLLMAKRQGLWLTSRAGFDSDHQCLAVMLIETTSTKRQLPPFLA